MPLFDTAFLIDLTRGDKGAISIAKQVDGTADIKAISVVTVHEYLRGVFYHHLESQRERLLAAQKRHGKDVISPFEFRSG